ncbi:MAG: hypothetical protein RQ757_05125 [Pseudomonadales bacterium]|nr:hypothetical protein [Pseudomonadales bacterium]
MMHTTPPTATRPAGSVLMYLLAGLLLPMSGALTQELQAQEQQAQELRLFEPIASNDSANDNQPVPGRESRTEASAPQFTLIGSSRIGNRYRALLRTAGGETVALEGQPGSQVPVPGHEAFQVQGFGSGELSVVYPGDTPCVSFQDQGLNCTDSRTATLSLTTAAPVVARQQANGTELQQEVDTAQPDAPGNPFAAALRRARNRDQSPEDVANARAAAQRFQGNRIAPEDVPEGMRVVRTPFGDRLVEDR